MRIVLTFVLIMFLIDWSLSQNVESYVRFRVRGNSELRKLSNTVSIAGVAGDTVFTFVSELEKSTLQAMGYVLEELPLPGKNRSARDGEISNGNDRMGPVSNISNVS